MTQWAYFEGAIRPDHEARISVRTQTFNYGTGAFGGIRGYWNEAHGELYLFRVLDHYRRFLNSGRILMSSVPESAEDLVDITLEMMRREGYRQDCYIRPILYKADEGIVVRLHNLRDAVTIYSLPFGRYIDTDEGARVCTSSWRRVDDTTIPPRGKIIGSYVNSALIKTEANLNGFDEAIVLDQNGHVAEGSAENIFLVRDGALVTPPLNANVLEGITRKTIMTLATEALGLTVIEREIDRTELYFAEEAFFCGTGVQVTHIASLDHRPIANGRMGPVTERVRDLYFRVVRGDEPRYAAWNTPVYGTARVQGATNGQQVRA